MRIIKIVLTGESTDRSVSSNCPYAESRMTEEEMSSNDKYFDAFYVGLYTHTYI
jgi:hypothetical protein